jgi:glutamyl-tRNA synthetase
MNKVRARFAPSPTGPLHIGGVRTALYNYLFARKFGGVFILRIEDTDQTRYVSGAEKYIIDSLNWLGLSPDEGPGFGGEFGPYRQSERKALYQKYAQQLIDSGHAYYCFDTPEDQEEMRSRYTSLGMHSPKYNYETRGTMKNSLTLSEEETQKFLQESKYTHIRLKVPQDVIIEFKDIVRGDVAFNSNELDDKVLLKADGMPTYHLANIVDDHSMEISHVIRGEEWLSSTAHHVLLYRSFGWEDTMPQFCHLPLILKPNGKGKLSKRDGAKFGFPVFPLSWEAENEEESFEGFKEYGFDPKAVINFLALLGWNPGNDEEIFELGQLEELFKVEQIVKSGARFDIDKAHWFNQQYLIKNTNQDLAKTISPLIEQAGYQIEDEYLENFCGLMKERVETYPQFIRDGYYFFEEVKEWDEKTLHKKYKSENEIHFNNLIAGIEDLKDYNTENLQTIIKSYIHDNELSFGSIFPILRIALSGSVKGPDLFEMMELLGKSTVVKRLKGLLQKFAND